MVRLANHRRCTGASILSAAKDPSERLSRCKRLRLSCEKLLTRNCWLSIVGILRFAEN